jgi:hypothetical protein
MAVTAVKVVPTSLLPNAAAAFGSAVPTGVVQTLTRAVFVNIDTVVHNISVYCVPLAGTAGGANQLIKSQAIEPGATYISPELAGLNMLPGDQLWAFADTANEVNMTISGVQLS